MSSAPTSEDDHESGAVFSVAPARPERGQDRTLTATKTGSSVHHMVRSSTAPNRATAGARVLPGAGIRAHHRSRLQQRDQIAVANHGTLWRTAKTAKRIKSRTSEKSYLAFPALFRAASCFSAMTWPKAADFANHIRPRLSFLGISIPFMYSFPKLCIASACS